VIGTEQNPIDFRHRFQDLLSTRKVAAAQHFRHPSMKYTVVNVREQDIEKLWIIRGLNVNYPVMMSGTKTANLSRPKNRRAMNHYAAVVHGAQRAKRKWQGAKSSQLDHHGVSLTGAVECRGRLDAGPYSGPYWGCPRHLPYFCVHACGPHVSTARFAVTKNKVKHKHCVPRESLTGVKVKESW